LDAASVSDDRTVGTAGAGLQSHHRAGEIPGAGRYQCEVCGTRLTLAEANEALPVCPYCHGTEFRRVHE
jgi:rubrerythrin